MNEERKRREGKAEVERRGKRQRRICDWVEAMRGLTGGEEGCYRMRANIGILENGNSLCGETIDKMIFFRIFDTW